MRQSMSSDIAAERESVFDVKASFHTCSVIDRRTLNAELASKDVLIDVVLQTQERRA
jgi:hypothetical protein